MRQNRRSVLTGAASLAALSLTPGCSLRQGQPKQPGEVDVLVLGAGVAGLNAAWLLEQEGLSVTVLEGRNRVGGRILTLMDQPGYPEMGFNSMAEGYGRGIDLARRANLALVDVGERFRYGPPMQLYINGQRFDRESWAAFEGNPFPAEMKAMMPWELVAVLVSKNNRLADWTRWSDPENAALDISLRQFLSNLGLNNEAIELAQNVSPYYGTSADDVSALMMEFNDGFVKSQIATGFKSLAVEGGNQRLPEAMAAMLKGDLLLGKEVVAISSDDTRSEVHCADGDVFSARKVICSLPFSTLRHVRIEPGLTGVQAEAVATLAYQPLSICFVTATSPFWEEDGHAPGMWTNGPLCTVMPQRFGATIDEITGFMVQARGAQAQYWDSLGEQDAKRLIVGALEELRPAAKGKVEAAAFHSWSGERFNQGDWAYFGPGQPTRLVGAMSRPAGRVHFCGEHTAVGARGLEGALESSERAVLEVLSA